jgi:signal transduction histidine kinase
MPNGGRLTISAENQTVDANDAARDMQAKPGRYVCITVTDSATGIPPQIIDRIFEPFFTTKEISRVPASGCQRSSRS